MRNSSVFNPRLTANPAAGSSIVPSSLRAGSIAAMRSRAPMIAPAVTSLWPLRYFVTLCITRSTPNASGCWRYGVANVLSMTDVTPAARQIVGEKARAAATGAGRNADLQLELADVSLPMAEDYLAKMTEELLQNAFKFSKPGSPVKVTLAASPTSVSLAINDRGRGLTADQIARIGAYMQFNRRSQEQQGAGLGLIITKRITELHGGTLTLASNAEAGTTVTVKLPPPG